MSFQRHFLAMCVALSLSCCDGPPTILSYKVEMTLCALGDWCGAIEVPRSSFVRLCGTAEGDGDRVVALLERSPTRVRILGATPVSSAYEVCLDPAGFALFDELVMEGRYEVAFTGPEPAHVWLEVVPLPTKSNQFSKGHRP